MGAWCFGLLGAPSPLVARPKARPPPAGAASVAPQQLWHVARLARGTGVAPVTRRPRGLLAWGSCGGVSSCREHNKGSCGSAPFRSRQAGHGDPQQARSAAPVDPQGCGS